MLTLVRQLVVVGMVAGLVLGAMPMRASVRSCTASIVPATVQPAATPVFDVSVTNTGGPTIRWMQIQRPNEHYVVDAAGLEGWEASIDESGMVLTNGTLPINESFAFTLAVRTGLFQSAAANWIVRVSDEEDGLAATTCTGSNLATAISGHFPSEGEGQRISGLTVDPTTTTATVRWYSDVPTGSVVFYGKTSDHGSNSTYSEEFVTTHKVVLTGLSPGTVYHFQAAGLDEGGNPSYSGNSTFMTDKLPASNEGGVTSPGTGGGASATAGTAGTEAVPPTVTLTTKLAGAYRAAPVLEGTAQDNVAIAKVDYSIDDGKNWLPAAVTARSSGRRRSANLADVAFRFEPVLRDDGNYMVVVRATDTAGNWAVTPAAVVVIDRLPPRLAGSLVVQGVQVMTPDASGVWPAVVGADQQLLLHTVGGVTEMTVEATRQGAKRSSQLFSLQRDGDSGLWKGVLGFQMTGRYHLTVQAEDGAGNRMSSSLPVVAISRPAQVLAGGQPVSQAQVTLYYREAASGEWVVWDGSALGQKNPQLVDKAGGFQMTTPAGWFYLRAEAPGFKTLVTKQFRVERAAPLRVALQLERWPKIRLGSWTVSLPWAPLSQVAVEPLGSVVVGGSSDLIGRSLPSFELPTTTGTATAAGLLGRPVVMSVLGTWAPVTNEQLPVLKSLARDESVRVVPLVVGEPLGAVRAFMVEAGFAGPVVMDERAELGQYLGPLHLPTHYIMNRQGVIRAVLTGVMTEQKLREALNAADE